jgi:protoporphyrinogen/coproporphyrinogen III oxidase
MIAGTAPRVIVAGAGVTGLTTAWHLSQRGVDVVVIEAEDEVGGVMRSTWRDGYLVEHGPNSCHLTPELLQLIDALHLGASVQPAAPDAQRRYIVRRGVSRAVPTSPQAMLSSPLFSLAGKLRILAEPLIAPYAGTSDESVGAFIRRRLGAEPLRWAVDPFVSGVYAGDPEQLSVRHAFPTLFALEKEHGSLVRGMFARQRAAKASGSRGGARAAMISFADGMGMLPLTLAAQLGSSSVQLGARITAVQPGNTGCRVSIQYRDGQREEVDAASVVSTLPMHALARVELPDACAAPLAQLRTLSYPPVASLALGFRRADVAHALDGFGCLVPSAEGRTILGVLFSSTLFPNRAPDGMVLLTCFVGGTRQPQRGLESTDVLVERILPELQSMFGVCGAPKFIQHSIWPHAIPQYNLGHDRIVSAAEAVEAALPGLFVDGQFRRGVSVGDCVAAGARIAQRALDALGQRRSVQVDDTSVPFSASTRPAISSPAVA